MGEALNRISVLVTLIAVAFTELYGIERHYDVAVIGALSRTYITDCNTAVLVVEAASQVLYGDVDINVVVEQVEGGLAYQFLDKRGVGRSVFLDYWFFFINTYGIGDFI